jgi:ribokinase
MAALGSAVRLIGTVGDDANGRFLLDQAESAGVDVSGARSAPRHTRHGAQNFYAAFSRLR